VLRFAQCTTLCCYCQNTLNGHQLKHVDVAKYLGIQISHDLCWEKHIDYITSKANSTFGFLRRNINISNPQIKEHSYKTLVRPILEYSQSVWDIRRLVQLKRSSRSSEEQHVIHSTDTVEHRTSSVSSMLSQLNWQPLVERRRHARLVMFYKIHYRLVSICIPLTSKFHLQPACTENMFAYSSDYHLQSFFPRTVTI